MNEKNVIFIDHGINLCNELGNHLRNNSSLNYLNANFFKDPQELEEEIKANNYNSLKKMAGKNRFLDKTYLITTDNSAEKTLILSTLAKNSKLASQIRKVILLCYKYDFEEFQRLKDSNEGQEKLGFIKDKIEFLPFDEEGIGQFNREEDLEDVKNQIDNLIQKDTLPNLIKEKLQIYRNQAALIFDFSYNN